MSMNPSDTSSSYTTLAGAAPATIAQKMQSSNSFAPFLVGRGQMCGLDRLKSRECEGLRPSHFPLFKQPLSLFEVYLSTNVLTIFDTAAILGS